MCVLLEFFLFIIHTPKANNSPLKKKTSRQIFTLFIEKTTLGQLNYIIHHSKYDLGESKFSFFFVRKKERQFPNSG